MTDSQLYLLLQIYNDAVSALSWKYQIRLKQDKPLKEYSWYEDLQNLYNIIHSLGAKPREYIGVQVNNYKPINKLARAVPTIRMMTSMKAVENWERSKVKPMTAKKLSNEYLIQASQKYMEDLMKANHIPNEEEFFKDPFMIQMVSKIFLIENPVFNRLMDSGYYSRFGLSRENFS